MCIRDSYNIHPKFVRFPGGCYVEGQESPENAFHWEKTIGPIEERPGHKNVNWRYRTSDGMGFDEYLQLSQVRAQAILAILESKMCIRDSLYMDPRAFCPV